MAGDVNCLVLQLEAYLMAAVITWWKRLVINAGYFMPLPVLRVVNDCVNAGSLTLLPRLKDISCICHVHFLSDVSAIDPFQAYK